MKCPRCDGQKYDKGTCPVCRNTGTIFDDDEPPDPDMNADGPAERAHRQDEARRMK